MNKLIINNNNYHVSFLNIFTKDNKVLFNILLDELFEKNINLLDINFIKVLFNNVIYTISNYYIVESKSLYGVDNIFLELIV